MRSAASRGSHWRQARPTRSSGSSPGEAGEALAAYRRFVRERVLTPDGRAREDSQRAAASPRLYDLPWLVLLFSDGEPEVALRILRAYYDGGGERFLAIGTGLAAQRLVRRLPEPEASEVAGLLLAHAHAHASAGSRHDLPAHEVNYEQSMVAPLLEILCCARDRGRRRLRSTPRSSSGCRGCSRSAARSRTCACATSRSATGTATGSAARSCGATSSRTTGAC